METITRGKRRRREGGEWEEKEGDRGGQGQVGDKYEEREGWGRREEKEEREGEGEDKGEGEEEGKKTRRESAQRISATASAYIYFAIPTYFRTHVLRHLHPSIYSIYRTHTKTRLVCIPSCIVSHSFLHSLA